DLSVEQVTGQPILRITLRPEELARYGLSARTVLDLVEAIGGKAVGEVVEGQLRFPLVVRLPEEFRENPEAIGAIPLSAPGGEQVPLSRVAEIKRLSGPKMITREWSRRRVTVQCNVRGRDVGSFVKDAQQQIAARVEIPRDKFRVEWGGQFENMQRAQRRLMIVVPGALFLILGLLYLTYRSPTDTFLVFASVPFACIGGVVAVAFREMPLSISAAVGFITLSGVSVLSSMVLMSAWRAARDSTRDSFQLARDVSVSSLRTIIMTALVASVGFIPMAVSQGSGAEVQRPLATVVIGGVITSALFTLVLLPVLLSYRRAGTGLTTGVNQSR
ncbi:MAG: efflux RND transporter permease subunit, partial [Planctomycetaceae bacterium]